MDRLTEMEAFATVVDQGGFTDAARKLGISKSAVSKHVASLEARLGARLLNRTTRRVSPTEIGLAYYDRARRVLNDAGDADALVSAMQADPAGLLKVSAMADFAQSHVSPLLGEFLARYPEMTVSLEIGIGRTDPVRDGFDVVIGAGPLADSTLIARKFAVSSTRLVAAPSYLDRVGRPRRIDDLNEHKLLHYVSENAGGCWRLKAPSGEVRQVRTEGWLMANDANSLLNAAMAGLGIARLPEYLFADPLRRGLLEEVLADLPVEPVPLSVAYAPGRFTQPKVRAFVAYLAERFAGRGIGDW